MRGDRPRPFLRLLIYPLLVGVLTVGTSAEDQAINPVAATSMDALAADRALPGAPGPAQEKRAAVEQILPPITTALSPTSFDQLKSDLNAIAGQSGGRVGLSLQELSGPRRIALSIGGDQSFYAASAYKLPLLMAEAQQIASGQASPNDVLCYDPSDQEDGWFTDYGPGACYSRQELAERTGLYSDNTAAHILVRYLGGPNALNAFARSAGMTESALWIPNTTTPNDLANALANEALGRLGGSAAQQWLYPLLIHTANEEGIPAGLPGNVTVVHKIGTYGGSENDSAYVTGDGIAYVLSVAIDGPDEATGWRTIAQISARIWQYEASRPQYVTPPAPTPAAIIWPDRRR